jgi:hypothetical protein
MGFRTDQESTSLILSLDITSCEMTDGGNARVRFNDGTPLSVSPEPTMQTLPMGTA